MVHNRECPKCGTIGEWNRQPRKKKMIGIYETTSPFGIIYIPIDGVKCSKCNIIFEPRSHEQLIKALTRVMKEIET